MTPMNEGRARLAAWLGTAAAAASLLSACSPRDPMSDPRIAAACAQAPFVSAEQRLISMQAGYRINEEFDCIDKQSFFEVERENARNALLRAERAAQASKDAARTAAPRTLAAARAGFTTSLARKPTERMPFPRPPADLFVRSDYESKVGRLAAWITPDPRDGEKHPAIIWITGGDSSSLDDFWTEGDADNDQSASAWRKAGVIMMFPTLRGGNENPGAREFFLGEVDDVLAAAEHLARQSYVDPGQVYLGGHSTGGTLALLTAESGARFAAVFAFGPVARVDQYPDSLAPVSFEGAAPQELELRSPIHWLDGIASPVYLIEGAEPPGNIESLEALCAASRNPRLHCVPVPQKNHFSVLNAAARKLAARIAIRRAADVPLLRAAEFDEGAAAR